MFNLDKISDLFIIYIRECRRKAQTQPRGHPGSWQDQQRDKSVSVLDMEYWGAAGGSSGDWSDSDGDGR